ncbi:ScbA/BarX family gamma-butyrolactone biosynthesis protein [Streptomyces longwoodensis]|uniref:ScbA/BarX family gamma-butyrolactone biosynthesis protein n=1 Tax=Streptomyces longwoodensis TaxID=68231 RepID=UPI00099E4AFF|nr:ScbA/BarX family gamma-butyrolactone biosynthesis protein [Streptomyces longwoodensis]
MSHLRGYGIGRPRLVERVPRELVHKDAAAEVLLTGWTSHGGDRHTVRARWPRFHDFYRPRNRRFDPLLLVETVRQTFPLLSHVAYGVPFGSHLVWDRFHFEVQPRALLVPRSGADVLLEITCSDVRMRKGCLVSMTMHATVRLNGRRVGAADTRFTNHSPAVYRRLRGRNDVGARPGRTVPPPPPLPPATVGHARPGNVVLAATGSAGRWQLRTDQDHPILFDHPVDHAPGMLLLEALRQAAHAVHPAPGTTVTGMSVSFQGWVELDAPAWVSVTPLRRNALCAVVEQNGRTCLSGEVVVGNEPADRTLGQPSPVLSGGWAVDAHLPGGRCWVVPHQAPVRIPERPR